MKNKDIFKIRYVEHQIFEQIRANDLLNNGFLSKGYKHDIYAQIKSNPLKSPYLVAVLFARAVYKSLYANCHAYQVKHKIKSKPYKALHLVPLYLVAKILQVKNWARYKVLLRFWRGKVDMPYFELVLTTRCTLRCESCGNLMQYFSPKNNYTCTLDGIFGLLDKLFSVIDSVAHIKIIGGEPLLFKDIVKVVERLDSEPKVKSFGMVTNGTIKLKENLLTALAKSKKFWLDISDYSTSPNLKIKLYQKEIFSSLEAYKIPYIIRWNDNPLSWWEPGKIYKRGRSKEKIIENYRACMMPCVSVMSNESLPKSTIGGGQNESSDKRGEFCTEKRGAESKGQIFICPVASSLSRLKGLGEFSGDFISLDSRLTKKKFWDFYAQDFFKACDYCHDMSKGRTYIPMAIQTDKTLELNKS